MTLEEVESRMFNQRQSANVTQNLQNTQITQNRYQSSPAPYLGEQSIQQHGSLQNSQQGNFQSSQGILKPQQFASGLILPQEGFGALSAIDQNTSQLSQSFSHQNPQSFGQQSSQNFNQRNSQGVLNPPGYSQGPTSILRPATRLPTMNQGPQIQGPQISGFQIQGSQNPIGHQATQYQVSGPTGTPILGRQSLNSNVVGDADSRYSQSLPSGKETFMSQSTPINRNF